MNQRFTIRSFAWLGVACLLMAFAQGAGAQVAEPPPTAAAPTSPVAAPASMPAAPSPEQLKPAADAAWAVLMALRDYVHASQTLDNPHQRAEDLAKASHTLMALVGLRPGGDPEDLLTYVSLWPAVVARYVDGFERDKLVPRQANHQVEVTTVVANPQDRKACDQLFQEITKGLRDQGQTGQDLSSRRQVLLTRELAQRGIGYPVDATIVLIMRKDKGQWKATELALQPPHVLAPGSQPVRRLSLQALPAAGTINVPQTQPAQ